MCRASAASCLAMSGVSHPTWGRRRNGVVCGLNWDRATSMSSRCARDRAGTELSDTGRRPNWQGSSGRAGGWAGGWVGWHGVTDYWRSALVDKRRQDSANKYTPSSVQQRHDDSTETAHPTSSHATSHAPRLITCNFITCGGLVLHA